MIGSDGVMAGRLMMDLLIVRQSGCQAAANKLLFSITYANGSSCRGIRYSVRLDSAFSAKNPGGMRAPGGQAYLFQACLRGEYLILAYPYVGTTVGPRVIPNFGISSHQHPAEPWPLPGHHDSPTQLLHTTHTGHTGGAS